MRKWITFLMTLLVASSASYVSAFAETQLNFEAGYRRDEITWKSRFPSSSPDFETKTKYKDLDIFQLGLNVKTGLGCNLYARGSAHFGWILDGKIERSTSFDFSASPFFSEEFTISADECNIVDGRWVFDIDVAIGYPFYFCDCTTSISPVIGYSFDAQNLCHEDNERFVFDSEGFGFSDDCCCNKLVNRWHGPFIGVDFNYNPCNGWNLYAALEYHWAHLKTRRHFANTFDFFEDCETRSRRGHGWVFNVGASYDFSNCWTLGLDLRFKDFTAHHRHHHDDSSSFFSDFSDIFSSESGERIRNSVDWRSCAISVTFGRQF